VDYRAETSICHSNNNMNAQPEKVSFYSLRPVKLVAGQKTPNPMQVAKVTATPRPSTATRREKSPRHREIPAEHIAAALDSRIPKLDPRRGRSLASAIGGDVQHGEALQPAEIRADAAGSQSVVRLPELRRDMALQVRSAAIR
jgi:hypothetical protein